MVHPAGEQREADEVVGVVQHRRDAHEHRGRDREQDGDEEGRHGAGVASEGTPGFSVLIARRARRERGRSSRPRPLP